MYTAGIVQFTPIRHDVQRNIAALYSLLAGQRADLLVLPELANSGYLYTSPESLAPCAEPGDGSGPFLKALQGLAVCTGGLLVAGFAEWTAQGLYNSAAAVSADGVEAIYRKVHLFADEKDLFLPGDRGFSVFTHQGVRIGLMVCFDWVFPEAARTLALQGAQVIAHPANLVLPYCQQAMLTRSLENGVFSITANRCGTEDLQDRSLTFTGASQVVDPHGSRLAQASQAGECVKCVNIEPQAADNKWLTPRNHLLSDRRPEMYPHPAGQPVL